MNLLRFLIGLIPFKKLRHTLKDKYTAVRITRRGNKKYALLSYIVGPVNIRDENDKKLAGHSNLWECREIAQILLNLGYNVDAIDYRNNLFKPRRHYDLMFDIGKNLTRLAGDADIKILHLTTSWPRYQFLRAVARNAEFNKKHKCNYKYMRMEFNDDEIDNSLDRADFCTLIGNKHTFSTYPNKYRNKIHCVPVTASCLSYIKKKSDFVPQTREFLFFSGIGAVHKGLDLVLDVFIKHPEWTLNVIGAFENEFDFWTYYEPILKTCPNIRVHGFVVPDSEKFTEIIKRCFCFVFPSCSEGTASGAITALSVGLFPILSADCGVDLPKGCGMVIDDLSVESIEKQISAVMKKSELDVANQIEKIQSHVLMQYSRENFTKCVKRAMMDATGL